MAPRGADTDTDRVEDTYVGLIDLVDMKAYTNFDR